MTKMLPVQLLEIFQFCYEPLLYILLLLCDFSYGDIKQGEEKMIIEKSLKPFILTRLFTYRFISLLILHRRRGR